jgi:hypothetical protein
MWPTEEDKRERERFARVNARIRDIEERMEAKLSDDRQREAHLMTLGFLLTEGEDEAAECLVQALRRLRPVGDE